MSKSEIREKIHEKIDDLINKYEDTDFFEELLSCFSEKIPQFLEKQKKNIDDRKEISECTQNIALTIYEHQCKNFFYNTCTGVVLKTTENNGGLRFISNDELFFKIIEHIPQKYLFNKNIIFRIIRNKIKNTPFYKWKPCEKATNEITEIFATLFDGLKHEEKYLSARFIMSFIGSIICHDDEWEQQQQIWWGNNPNEITAFLSNILCQTFRMNYTSITQIKHKFGHGKYDFEKIFFIYIPNYKNRKRIFKCIQNNHELFFATCFLMHEKYPCNYWKNHKLFEKSVDFRPKN